MFNADGSCSVGVYADGSPGQLVSVDVYNAVGVLIETDTYSAGQLVSSNVFAAASPVTSYDPASGLATGATASSPDGSAVTVAYAAGLPGQMSVVTFYDPAGTLLETDTYDAAGRKASTQVPFGSGTLLTRFDPTNGMATGTTQENADGTVIVSTFVPGEPGELIQVQSFGPGGVPIETDLYGTGGKMISTDVFYAEAGDLLTVYDPSTGLATGTTRTNADGSLVKSIFAVGAPEVFASVDRYNSAGVLVESDVYNAAGQQISTDVFSDEGDLLSFFDPSTGIVASTTQTTRDGSKVIMTFANGVATVVDKLNAAGMLTDTDLYNGSGSLISTDVFSADADLLTAYDPSSGLATGYTQTNADGSKRVGVYANGQPGRLASVQVFGPSNTLTEIDGYSADGAKITSDLLSSDGSDLLTTYDPTSGLATGFTQTGASGSKTIGLYATGIPGQLANLRSFDPSGALIETELYNAGGQKVWSDVVLPGGGDLLTAFDPGSPVVTSTTQANADGSRVVSRYGISLNKVILQQDFYNAAQVLVETDLFSLTGLKTSSTLFAGDGSSLLTTYDPVSGLATSTTQSFTDGTKTLAIFAAGKPVQIQTQYIYNASSILIAANLFNPVGQKLSATQYNADASTLTTTFDPPTGLATRTTLVMADGSRCVSVYADGTDSQLASVSFYSSLSTPLETDLYNGAGKKISTEVYASDGSTLLTSFDPISASATGTIKANPDGSKVATVFAPRSPGQPVSIISFDPSGKVTERDLFNASGQRVSTDVYTPGNGHLLTTYDPVSGLATGTTQIDADGSRAVTVYAPGLPGQLASVNVYSPANILVETDLYNPAGQKISTDVFTRGAGDLLTNLDTITGKPTQTVRTKADKSRIVTVYKSGSSTALASLSTYNAGGLLVAAQLWGDDGSRKVYAFKSAGVENGYTITALDGSKTVATFGPGNEALLIRTALYSSTGRVTEVDTYNSAGVKVSASTQGSDGSRGAYKFDPSAGALTSYTIFHPDKSRTTTDLAIVGKPYSQQTVTYSAAGAMISMSRWYGDLNNTLAFTQINNRDGSKVVRNYDMSGRESSRVVLAKDGSKDIFTATYGAGAMPTSFKEDHYSAIRSKLWTDVTTADGTHQTTAWVAGISLAASTGSSDTLTAARAGYTTFLFDPGFGQDTVAGFHVASGPTRDIIDLTALHLLSPGQTEVDFLSRASTQPMHDAVLNITATETITFKGISLASLSPDQFKF